ncbi:Csa1 family protein, partial [Staphylococcus aureus]|uniref:Csa1 family protein n=1 Tax=Staphylococcus aureus TaxID=1280 RepID=UPI0011A8C14E
EGFPHQEFDKTDKPTSIINSRINIQLKPPPLKSTPILLYINPNTTTPNRYFLITQTTQHKKGYLHNKHKKYPVNIQH